MVKRLTLVLFLIFPIVAFCQKWEFGFQLGTSNYIGDLAPDIVLSESHMASGIFLKKNVNPFISHTFIVLQGQISANDQNTDYLAIRNLSFFSSVTEFSYLFEFNFFPFGLGLHPNKFTPYTFVGIGGFIYEPNAVYFDKKVNLSKLDTEGEKLESSKKAYSLYQLTVPIGGGFKIKVNKNLNCSFNVGFRYTFTDYLDDVSTTYFSVDLLENEYGQISAELSDRSSEAIGIHGKQRGRPDLMDWYIFSGVTFSFQIRNKVCPFEF